MSLSLSPVESKSEVLLESLRRFYTPDNVAVLSRVLRNETKLSLRTLDWLCTNYAKKRNIVYVRGGKMFNVYIDYKASLKAYSKKAFDPFQRRDRVTLHGITTTVAQLNFFRWAITRGVLEYALEHAAEIEQDMLGALDRVKVQKPKAARRELSKAATKSATKTRVTVTVRFA